MPRTFYSPEAYADELSFLNSELGYALFHPGLLGAHQPVAIGDIGTIQGGSFIRFFNAFRQATDEINQTDTGTPAEFKPVPQVNQRVNNNDASYSPGVFGSKGVTQMSLDAGAGLPIVAGADIRTSFRIAFTKESDVALMTKWKSKASNAVFIQPLAEYFLRNHQRFLDHIRGAHGSATIRSDELVFVTATLMTGDWVMARASTGSEEFNLGFDCNYAGVGGGHVQWNYTSTLTSVLPSREGPDRPPSFDYSVTPQFDQCIFLKRLRIFDRSVFSWLKQKLLLSAADSVEGDLQRLHLKKKISDDNDQSIFGTNTGAVSFKTNLLVVYIFEKSDPDLVLIHEDDIHHAIPEGTEAEDVADALETSFRNGNVFIEILSEISQEIGKKVASISTRPLPASAPGEWETIVVDDVLNDVIGNNSVAFPAPRPAPDFFSNAKQIIVHGGSFVAHEAGYYNPTQPKAAAITEMTASETPHPSEATPPTNQTPATWKNHPPESSELSEAESDAAPTQADGMSRSHPTTYGYVTDNRNIFNNQDCQLNANVMIINNQPDPLLERTAQGALYNSFERYDPPKCHPGTRLALVEAIIAWIKDGQKTSFIMWLYGSAGAGKSAIAQTIAEMCYQSGDLAASFFWSRTDPTRNDEKCLIATLAYQLLVTIPEIRTYVEQAIRDNLLLFSLSLEAQMESLIVKPLERAFGGQAGHKRVKLIVLDGLDECGTPNAQRQVLQVISKAVRKFPIRIVFLITSRQEQGISNTFNSDRLLPITSRLALDATYKPDDDIRHYLGQAFDSLKRSHVFGRYLPSIWPTTEQIEELVQKSSGQFIYASIVAKFISSPHHRPDKQLDIVLSAVSSENQVPFKKLDTMYRNILGSIEQEDLPRVLDVISCLIVANGVQLTGRAIEEILSYERGELRLFLKDLHSLIYIPDDDADHLHLHHASLRDFLVDPVRAGPFHIDQDRARVRFQSRRESNI